MNKNKINISVLIVTFALSSYLSAFALDSNIKVSVDGSLNTKSEVSEKSSNVNSDSEINATVGDDKSNDSIKDNDENNATTSGGEAGEEHRSFVSSFVQNLRSIAEREDSIGDEVKVIAKEQSDSSSTTVEAITKVENKGEFSRFLFGTDYKNIGTIRSEIVKIQNRINKLSVLASSTAITIADKQELNLQISALKSEQVKLNTFVDVNENKFSLLGWFVKLFNK